MTKAEKIALDDEAQHVLNQLGIDDQYIDINKNESADGFYHLDITDIGFKVIGAK
ncbi:hypothetical protein QIH01_09110 [Brevibacillus brevis]|uniref:hypothetical protein n=1 Tax=Brevibacillus brevis TaxID=1393 RepID=UPI000A71C3DB|nr:hypothetical protein [Brevibacillus brevis]WGV61284.1 hypothetical protein QIH01_09110 [Brevibacillus brevis]